MVSVHVATIEWARDGADFADNAYARRHHWTFDGGAVIAASSSPHVVPVPMSDASAVDPEEAFVAALSSCHMLWFLDLARRGGFTVDRYADAATGTMGRTGEGAFWVAKVDLHPVTDWVGDGPDAVALRALHDAAHQACFIANSVRSEIVVHLD